jgi:hypothetical protein
MIIFSSIVAIREKDFTWILVALLWGDIVIIEYCDAKLMKVKDELYNLQEEHINSQDKFIKLLMQEIINNKNTKIVLLKDIKIPKKYKEPKKQKLDERKEYFETFRNFKVPVIIDKDNNLIDGYTTYLIAKNNGFNSIEVRVKNGR